MVCRHCGYQNNPGAKFCSRCGKKLAEPEKKQNKNMILIAVLAVAAGLLAGYLLFGGDPAEDAADAGRKTVTQTERETPAPAETEHEHSWQEADCENPKMCLSCGETAGTALGHDWKPAVWNSPSRCRLCGKTEGLAAICTGDVVTFGSYPQGKNASDKEEIEWIVLDTDGTKALLLSRYCLDNVAFHNKQEKVKWENCSLRTWLNGTFLQTAFSFEEQDQLLCTTIYTEDNPEYGTYGGACTEDRVFLLSIQEAECYFGSDSARKAEGTTYADAQGAQVYKTGTWWRLRSPGKYDTSVASVYANGKIEYAGDSVSDKGCAIRPAIWVDIS